MPRSAFEVLSGVLVFGIYCLLPLAGMVCLGLGINWLWKHRKG